jgi:hypothetical protein
LMPFKTLSDHEQIVLFAQRREQIRVVEIGRPLPLIAGAELRRRFLSPSDPRGGRRKRSRRRR